MRRRRGEGRSPLTVGLIALVVTAIALFLGFTKSIPFRSHFEIEAAFRSSNNIKPGSPVRIAGVEVGKVVAVEAVSPGADAATVRMRIQDRGKPIHRDATASIRPRIFLEGNFFVDLRPGSPGAPQLDDGDSIPASQTSTPVQFDQVLKALKAPTRRDLQLTLGELSKAYEAGAAEAFNRSLEDQAPAFKFSAIVAEALLGRRPRDLSNIVRDLGTTAEALDRSPPQLKALIEDFNTTAAALAVERDALGEAIGELPRTLRIAGPALDALNAAFPATRRLAAEALPAVRSSGPTIAALRPLVAQLGGLVSRRELRGLSSALARTTPSLAALARTSSPLLEQVRPLAGCINNVIVPWSRDKVPDPNFPATGPVYQTAVKWLPAIAGESRSFDANGQWFKVLGQGGIETFQLGEGLFGTALFPIVGVNPPKPAARPPLRPDVACETQQPPDLRTVPGDPPPSVRTNPDDPKVKARYAKARETAIAVLADELKQAGVGGKVLDTEATLDDVRALARRAGNLEQLERVARGEGR